MLRAVVVLPAAPQEVRRWRRVGTIIAIKATPTTSSFLGVLMLFLTPLCHAAVAGGVRSQDDGVGDLHDLVDGKFGRVRVMPNRLWAYGLVDTDGADGAVGLLDHIALRPGDDSGKPGRLDGRARHRFHCVRVCPPCMPSHHYVRLHRSLPRSTSNHARGYVRDFRLHIGRNA